MLRSHKARLAIVATGVAAIVVGGVFVSIAVWAIRDERSETHTDLERSFESVAAIPLSYFSMKELGEVGPSLSARVFSEKGKLVRSRGRMPPYSLGAPDGFAEKGHWLFLARHAGRERVVLGADIGPLQESLRRLEITLAALWLPLAFLVGGATWLAAEAVFRPLKRLGDAAARIEGTDLGQRLPPPDEAEFGDLAQVLNHMLGRIEEAALRSERFAADAAHELRTPLAIIQTQIETTLLRPRTAEEHVASHRALLSEVERLSTIVEALLRSTRAPVESVGSIALAPLVHEVVVRCACPEVRSDLHEVYGLVPPEEVAVVTTNLIENARRYSPPGTQIEVSLFRDAGVATLCVVDHGPGIGEEHRERVFERLYRADEGRSRASGGAGIGLAVCRRLVEARGGTITTEPTPGGGATMIVRWPVL